MLSPLFFHTNNSDTIRVIFNAIELLVVDGALAAGRVLVAPAIALLLACLLLVNCTASVGAGLLQKATADLPTAPQPCVACMLCTKARLVITAARSKESVKLLKHRSPLNASTVKFSFATAGSHPLLLTIITGVVVWLISAQCLFGE